MPQTTKPRYHHGDLRNALIAAAVRILKDRGIAGLSLREVAAAAGVSHAAPYRHFPDKQALLNAIAAQGHERLRDGCRAAQRDWPRDPKRQWIEAGMHYLRFVLDNPEVAQVMFGGAAPNAAPDATLEQAIAEAVAALADIVDNGKSAGLYRGRNSRDIVLTSLSTVHGLSLLIGSGFAGRRLSHGRARALAQRIAETLWRGLSD
ncbi:MAG TPA: TetR/AcrR family transcriptional regulator [Acidiferrobacterales bacterium]